MKVKGMHCDQYKMSIEARPLQVLYTKYSPGEVISQCQTTRPLGRIRKLRRPSSEQLHNNKHNNSSDCAAVDSKGASNHYGGKEMKTGRRSKSEKITAPPFRSETNISTLDYKDSREGTRGAESVREREHTTVGFPSLNLSRSQAFENKFKIAASRGQGHESPPLKRNKTFAKKVVHLPLFRIDLKTYVGESEESQTVAKTRESIRKLMELHASKMKSNSVMTANIKNYEFSAPTPRGTVSSRTDAGAVISKPFHAKPALRSSRAEKVRGEMKAKYPILTRPRPKSNSTECGSPERNATHISAEEYYAYLRANPDANELDEEVDDSMLSIAMRPDTSLTLGSTMHHLDRVIKSPGSDEIRELNEALMYGSTGMTSAWPSIDELHKLTPVNRSHSRGNWRSKNSRPGTVLDDLIESPDDAMSDRWREHYMADYQHTHGQYARPILRYTTKQSTQYKLDPIVVPSHTCNECPMCNIYNSRDMETDVPPNTPNTSQFMMEPDANGMRPPFIRGTKLTNRPEVMHISRIYMDGAMETSTDDGHVMHVKTS